MTSPLSRTGSPAALYAAARGAAAALACALLTAGCGTGRPQGENGPTGAAARSPGAASAGTPGPTGGRRAVHGLVLMVTARHADADRGTTTIETADPGTGATHTLATWPIRVLRTGQNPAFDSSYTRMAAARSGTVGYLGPDGRYTAVGPADGWPTPRFTYVRDRLVTLTRGGRLVDARTRRPVPGYARMQAGETVVPRPSGQPRGIYPKSAGASLVATPYGTVSLLPADPRCAADPSRPGDAICQTDAQRGVFIAVDAAGRQTGRFGTPRAAGSLAGVTPDGSPLLSADDTVHDRWSLTLIRRATGAPHTLAADLGGEPQGAPVSSPDGRRVAVTALPEDAGPFPTRRVRVIAHGRPRTVPLHLPTGAAVTLLAWR